MFLHPNSDAVYRCPYCAEFVSFGDRFCKNCGQEFTEDDVATMKKVNSEQLSSTVVALAIFIFAIVLLTVFGNVI